MLKVADQAQTKQFKAQKAQAEAKAFSGELRYNVGGVDQGPPRCGSVVLSIPKVK